MPIEQHPYEGWEDQPTHSAIRLAAKRILVAEDDPELRSLIAERMRSVGCDVVEASNGERALDLLAASVIEPVAALRFELAIMDVRMPGMSGLEVVYLSRLWEWPIKVLLVTAFPDVELVEECERLGVPLLQKPFSLMSINKAAVAVLRGAKDVRGVVRDFH
ncbi:MAG: response regulator [Kofleriaceae bacterium]